MRIYGRAELLLEQDVNELHWGHPANRVVKSTLMCLYGLRRLLPEGLNREIEEYLAASDGVPAYDEGPREALRACEAIISRRSLDPSRDYFYRPCVAARPILQALGRALGGVPQVEDVAFRVEMPSTVESAIRNVTSFHLGAGFTARKEDVERLYARSEPPGWNPVLEPDIVVRPVSSLRTARAVLNVKYKERPTASDHHQLAAYARSYGAARAAFVTIADEAGVAGEVAHAETTDGVAVREYAVSPHAALRPAGLRRLGPHLLHTVSA